MLFLRVCMLYATIEKTKTDIMKTGAFDENKDIKFANTIRSIIEKIEDTGVPASQIAAALILIFASKFAPAILPYILKPGFG